jgi:hypothetical protein
MNKWKAAERLWDDYPSDMMTPLTTLEETKPATCVVIVE